MTETREYLTLSNGTELDGYAIEVDEKLYVYLNGITLADAFGHLINPEATAEITGNRFGEITVFTGYTHLQTVSEESGGMVSAVMKREVHADV